MTQSDPTRPRTVAGRELIDAIGGGGAATIRAIALVLAIEEEAATHLAALPTTPAPSLARWKRLQSAHHRTLRVTAVTCPDCKRERITP